MTKWVKVKNEKTNATAEVPEKSLEMYAKRGWKPIPEKKAEQTSTASSATSQQSSQR